MPINAGWPKGLEEQQACAARFNEVLRSLQAAEATTKLPREVLISAMQPKGTERSAICQEMLADKLQGQRQFNKEWFRSGKCKKRLSQHERQQLRQTMTKPSDSTATSQGGDVFGRHIGIIT